MSTAKRARPKKAKKYYTVEQANAMLPLLRHILRDVTELAHDLRQRYERINHLQHNSGKLTPAHQEEVQTMLADFERDQDKMHEFEDELRRLHVELKDYFTGLIDFRSMMDGREVYLCWRLGEPEVAHWHELDGGFSARKKLVPTGPEAES
jgi:hypothetical protein